MNRKVYLLFFYIFSFPLAGWADGLVREIRIEGIRWIEESTIRGVIYTKVGEELDPDLITKDIKEIYALGLVDDVIVEKAPFEGMPEKGWVVIYRIREKPRIKEIRFEGNKKLKQEDLDALVEIRKNQVYDQNKVSETVKKIEDEYRKKGMFLTRVSPRVEEYEGVVEVIFEIEEEKKPSVKSIDFYGNENFSDRELRRALQTKQDPALFFSRDWQDEIFSQDIYRVLYFYQDNGFIEAMLKAPERLLSPDLRYVFVAIFVDEGLQYRVGQIKFEGDLVAPAEELREGLTMREGEIFSKSKLVQDLNYLTDLYNNLGYALADIEEKIDVDKNLQLVNITYNIQKGRKVYLERIQITGNYRTYDKVIRRELKVKEGYLYSSSEVRRSQSRLLRLGYFEDVQMIPRPGSDEDRMGLEVAVKEGKSGALMAGGGYSSLEEFFFNIQYQQRNVLGLGIDINARAQASLYTQNYFLDFSNPYFLDTQLYLGTSLFSLEERQLGFTRSQTGGRITLGRKVPHSEYTRGFLSYRYVDTSLIDYPETATIYRRQPTHSLTSSLTFTFQRNALNNYWDPTSGSYVVGSLETAGWLLGGENNFIKGIIDARYYQPVPFLIKGNFLALRGLLGYIWIEDDERLLISERFFMGGLHSLRGYEYGAVSPVFVEDDGSYSRIGGNKEFLLSLEYVVPLGSQTGFKGVLFYDVGQVYNDNENLDLDNLRQDWGFGLRWISPLGPLRFELGFPINPREDERKQVFNFGIGSTF